LRLGIASERITPCHPEQNGRDERMHLTLKREATKPVAANTLPQQDRLIGSSSDTTGSGRTKDGMKVPADVYTVSPRTYAGLPHLEYPFHDWSATITHCGRVCYPIRRSTSARHWPASWSASDR
jgi:hypothetical protein